MLHKPDLRQHARWLSPVLALCLLLPAGPVVAADFTLRAAALGSVARPGAGDLPSSAPRVHNPTADRQSLRLMLDDRSDDGEWSVHMDMARQHLRGIPAGRVHSSDLFRYWKLSDAHVRGDPTRNSTSWAWELDRAYYKRRLGATSLSVGRQPVDWGAGRLWQPLNVFGAFAPTALDTDYKPGIDSAVLNWYPSDFSSLTAVYALAPQGDPALRNSGALHYRRPVGATAQLAIVAGEVIGNRVLGAAIEDDWRGIGWRVEALQTRLQATGRQSLFWIAGLDYQFEDGSLISLEWHDNGRGALRESELAAMQTGALVGRGLQQHRVRRVLGAALQKDLTPLLAASYTLLANRLQDVGGGSSTSLTQQISLRWSLGNEADLLFALSWSGGKGLDAAGLPRSEFGHLPAQFVVRWRSYF